VGRDRRRRDRGTGAAGRPPADVRAPRSSGRCGEALQRIPRGTTATYGEIARAIGRPTAARAVGRACASNRIALVIPCHRAVRSDGEPGGYRWGARRKQAILEREREA
jgi:AraC family transcriptional regulator of adaptative response/methylated-DNA-[protein]-cysteine methyltransferase